MKEKFIQSEDIETKNNFEFNLLSIVDILKQSLNELYEFIIREKDLENEKTKSRNI